MMATEQRMTPHNLRNIIFIIICICALSIAFIYVGAKKMNILPESFNNGTYSYLERSGLQTRPKVSLQNIKKGTFQSQTEKWLTTKVPKRDSVMLFNAKIQRGLIKTANLACGFDTIPTFFGSGFSYTEKQGVVAKTSVQQGDDVSSNYAKASQSINEFVSNNSNLRFTLAITDRIDASESNPTYSLTSKPINNKYRQSQFLNLLDSSIKYVDLTCADTNEYYEKHFKTDHHWNITGAADAYKKIMNSAFPELDQIEFANKIEYDEPEYWGSHSRRGLMKTLPGDKITDYVINMNGITIEINDKESNLENLEHIDTYNNRLFAKNLLSDRYIEYFHNNLQKVELISNEHTNRNLLIIGDSYVNPCERFYALSFDKVVHVDTQSFKDSLQQLTNENNFTDVLILQSDPNHYDDEQLAKFIKLLES